MINKSCILIPVYNSLESLKKTLLSIENTENIDLVLVDDGSNVPLDLNAIEKYYRAKGTINIIRISKNVGIERALNEGLKFIFSKDYTFIARLDCGDLVGKERFTIQEKFLLENPDVSIVGSDVKAIDENGNFLFDIKIPKNHDLIMKKMHFNCALIHPSVMIRLVLLQGEGYSLDYPAAEDYELFFRLSQYGKLASIDMPLTVIEINNTGISATKRKVQLQSRIKVIKKFGYISFLKQLGIIQAKILLLLPRNFINFLKKYR
ncbi:glycosyltransferase [Flammeovirga agarivorans]|uniref:Glycosyltransferase n=1 Tax=Flammeovirga agarivorans TaxID=2726742 RepID=A0A7X8XXC2_9BACT|nr:glycosyltransferase [Flammeovirga agarivorans]NLR93091.1 glycosyltransferase [Flammeovirga agarivorans]